MQILKSMSFMSFMKNCILHIFHIFLVEIQRNSLKNYGNRRRGALPGASGVRIIFLNSFFPVRAITSGTQCTSTFALLSETL